jgi:hypothetical protein
MTPVPKRSSRSRRWPSRLVEQPRAVRRDRPLARAAGREQAKHARQPRILARLAPRHRHARTESGTGRASSTRPSAVEPPPVVRRGDRALRHELRTPRGRAQLLHAERARARCKSAREYTLTGSRSRRSSAHLAPEVHVGPCAAPLPLLVEERRRQLLPRRQAATRGALTAAPASRRSGAISSGPITRAVRDSRSVKSYPTTKGSAAPRTPRRAANP